MLGRENPGKGQRRILVEEVALGLQELEGGANEGRTALLDGLLGRTLRRSAQELHPTPSGTSV